MDVRAKRRCGRSVLPRSRRKARPAQDSFGCGGMCADGGGKEGERRKRSIICANLVKPTIQSLFVIALRLMILVDV
jgi:hypothetical protein